MDKTIKKDIDKVVQWLRDKVEDSRAKGLLVGLSGGIDSAVVACLIKKAFPENSLAVILPIKSHDNDIQHGVMCAKACNIDYVQIDLEEEHNGTMEKIVGELKKVKIYNEKNHRVTDSNLRARLRMSTLYGIANNINYLVVGTDNASELYTGYFTKYGDGGVDLLPIATLKKRDVYKWASLLDVPREVLDKKPSAGLWEGQTDEKEMGTTYEHIDNFLDGNTIPDKDLQIIEGLHKRSEHKRSTPPYPNLDE